MSFLPIYLLLASLLGLNLTQSTVFLAITFFVTLLLNRRYTFHITTKLSSLYFISFCIYLIYVFLFHYSKYLGGTQSVDTAIYTQSIENYITTGSLETSFLGLRPIKLLEHHFFPFLLIVGEISKIVFNPNINLILLHILAIVLSLLAVFKIGEKNFNKNSIQSYFLCILFLLLPCNRIMFLKEVHDELYALPLILWAFYFFIYNKNLFGYALLIISFLMKETMFVVLSIFSIYDFLFLMSREKNSKNDKIHFRICLSIFFFIFGFLSFLIYSGFIKISWYSPTFSTSSRISSLKEFFSKTTLELKLWWLIVIILPYVPQIFLSTRVYLVKLCLNDLEKNIAISSISSKNYKFDKYIKFFNKNLIYLPFISYSCINLVSNFFPMYYPFYYYSVIPSSLFLITSFSKSNDIYKNQKLLIISCLIAFYTGPLKPNLKNNEL